MEIAGDRRNPRKTRETEGSPMRDALLQPRITRRSALQMAGAAALPALIKPARAAEPSTLRVAFAIQPATLDPQKMRVGGVDYNYVYNCFSRLTAQDPQLQMQPNLATSWEATVSESSLDTLTTHPIGTGPFKFVEYRPGDQLVMERNPDYFLSGLPRLDRVIIRIIPEFTTSVAALESGAVDAPFDRSPKHP